MARLLNGANGSSAVDADCAMDNVVDVLCRELDRFKEHVIAEMKDQFFKGAA